MTITIEITPEVEGRVRAEAAQQGQDVPSLLSRVVEERFAMPSGVALPASRHWTARELLALPPEQREPILAAAAAAAAPLYEADLALPPEQRELTAITATDGDELYGYDDERQAHSGEKAHG